MNRYHKTIIEGDKKKMIDSKIHQKSKSTTEIAERCGEKFFAGWAHNLLGEAALETNFSKALPQFEKSIAIFKETKPENELARSYFGLGRFYRKQGDHAQAQKYARKALGILNALKH